MCKFNKNIISILFIVYLQTSIVLSREYVLLVSFDGFRHDYLSFVDTPNFDLFIESGVHSNSLVPVFPSLTFPNHYSIATGAYAGTHNITGNSFYDKEFNIFIKQIDNKKIKPKVKANHLSIKLLYLQPNINVYFSFKSSVIAKN